MQKTAITEFSQTAAALSTLEEKYKVVPDATTTDGYQACVGAIRELRPLRTGLDKMRLSLNADDQARIKIRNSEAKSITVRLAALEDPIKAAKKSVDDKADREAEEARQVEIARIADITERIQAIKAQTDGLIGADVDALQMRLDAVRTITITEGLFAEFTEQAEHVYSVVMTQLEHALAERVALEEQQAEQQRVAEEQAVRQAELDRQATKQLEREVKAQEKIAAGQKEKREEAMRPEKDRLRDWMAKLRFIDGVELNDKKLINIQRITLEGLNELSVEGIQLVEDV